MIRLLKILAVLLVLIVIAMMALPQLLSTTYVKKRVANQLSTLTGRPVTIQGESSLSLQPYLTVAYTNVIVEDTTTNSENNLVVIETLKARLDVFAAFQGEINLAEIALIRPQFNLKVEQDGRKNWHTKNGAFAERLSAAPDSEPSSLTLGNVNIIDGIATIYNKKTGRTEELTGMSGSLSWPDILSPANLELTAVWRGENITGNANVDAPFELLKGGNTALEFSITSSPLEAKFNGSYNSTEKTAAGQLSGTSPSLKRLSEWLNHPIAAAEYMGNGSVSGEVSMTGGALEFPDSQVTIGNHTGSGRLQFFLDEKNVPSVNGTLAFDTLNLTEQNTISRSEGNLPKNALDLAVLQGIRIDLRISAKEVSSTGLELQNLAASIIIRDANATIDIGNAETMAGGVNGSLEAMVTRQQISIDANVLFKEIELNEFVKVLGDSTISPNGKGDVSLKLKSQGMSYPTLLSQLNGEVSLRSKQGTLTGINLTEITSATLQSPELTWNSLNGTTPYDELDVNIMIKSGEAYLHGSGMRNSNFNVTLGGRTDLIRGNLALRGILDQIGEPQPGQDKLSLTFFVGGTAASPLFIPLQTSPIKTPIPTPNDNQ